MVQHYGNVPGRKSKKPPAKVPKGFHRMPDGRLMEGETHPKSKKKEAKKEKPFGDLKEGALSKMLGIPEKDKIPRTLLRKIDKMEVGAEIMLPSGKKIKITPLLHKRVRFVINIALK